MAAKQDIIAASRAGIPLSGREVARVVRDKVGQGRHVRLRHDWTEGIDVRVGEAVRRAAIGLACEHARKTGRRVDVVAKDGYLLDQVDPESCR